MRDGFFDGRIKNTEIFLEPPKKTCLLCVYRIDADKRRQKE